MTGSQGGKTTTWLIYKEISYYLNILQNYANFNLGIKSMSFKYKASLNFIIFKLEITHHPAGGMSQ
jgi:hypothetical protein